VSVLRLLAQETQEQKQDRPFWAGTNWGDILGPALASGVRVDCHSALTSATVWRCVEIIASAVGVLPLVTYRRLEQGKERATDSPVYQLLRTRPNPLMDALTFRHTMTAHLLLWGNAYAEIARDAAGRPVQLWPIPPWRMTPTVEGARVLYKVRVGATDFVPLLPEDVIHLKGMSGEGMVGYSVIRHAAESIGLSLAMEKFGAAFFGNGARPGGVLEHPQKLGDAAAGHLRDSWASMHQGLSQAHRVAILEEGMKFHEIGTPPEEAQFLESRAFQREEIANWFGVPVHLLNGQNKPTFASVEQSGIDFVRFTLLPWLTRWEMECSYKLFSESEREEYFAEFKTEALVRGDQKSRYEAYRVALGRAGEPRWMEPNEIREAENMNPIDGLDDQEPAAAPVAPALPGQTPGADLNARAALVPPVEKAMARLVGREVKALSRKSRSETAKDFQSFAASFFAEQADLLADALAPLAEAYVAWTGRPARPMSVSGFAEEYCATARDAACAANAAGTLDAWLVTRAAEVPAAALRFLGAIGV